MNTMTSRDRRRILATEYRKALGNITPNMPGRYSGAQIAAAKGIARRRALAIIDQTDSAGRVSFGAATEYDYSNIY